MSNISASARKFYQEVAKTGFIWTVEDDQGVPAPVNSSGKRAMPFWSSAKRATIIITSVTDYANFRLKKITWTDFSSKWIPGLEKDGLLAGINWSGDNASGYDILPAELKANIDYELMKP